MKPVDKILIIDDQPTWHRPFKDLSLRNVCTAGKDTYQIVREVQDTSSGVEEVFINISIFYEDISRRLDYGGIALMGQLMFEIEAKTWYLLTFEKSEEIFNRNKIQIIHQLNNVKSLDYITFLKQEIFHER